MGSLVIGSCNYYSQVKTKAENRVTFHHQYDSKASERTDEGSSSTVTFNCETQMSSQEKSNEEELFVIGQLNERLTFLEKEAQLMKQDFYHTIQESKELMNEIYQQFQFIRCRDQATPDQFSKVRTKRPGGPGLSQVLCHDNLNIPSVIIKDFKARAVPQELRYN